MPRTPKPKPQSLAHIQRTMLDAVRRSLTADEMMQPRARDGSATNDIATAIIRPNDRLTSFARLEIYNQQYWWRLVGCLREDFRGLRAVLGDDAFERLSVAYVDAHPSRSWTLRNLGCWMPEFVSAHPALCGRHHALACDVAKVEWARVLAFDDPEWPLVDVANLGQTKKPVTIQPYIQLVEISHSVDKLMVKLKKHEQQTASNSAARFTGRAPRRLTVGMAKRTIHLAVHRVNHLLYYKRLEPEAARLLQLLRDGALLDEACERAFEDTRHPVAKWPPLIRAWFANWTELGWLCHAPSGGQ